MSRNGAFDRFRGIGAFCIVLIHAPPLYHSETEWIRIAGWILRAICQSAVPFFFLLSGWMMAARWTAGRRSWRDLLAGLGRLMILYCPWFALHLALDFAMGLPVSPDVVARRFAGFTDSTLGTTGYHLWFLPALALAQVATWASLTWTGSVRPALFSGAAIYLAMGVLDAAGGALPWGLAPHEGLGLSLAGVSTGAWLAVSGIPDRLGGKGRVVVLGLAALLVESFLWDALLGGDWSIYSFPILRLVFPALLVAYLSRHPDLAAGGSWGRLLDVVARNASVIYVAHVAVLTLVPLWTLVPDAAIRDHLVRWIVAFLVPIALGEVVRRAPWKLLRAMVS